MGACPANNKYSTVDEDKTNTEIWYCNYCKIIVTNGDVKLIDKNKIQRLLIGFSFGVRLRELKNKEKAEVEISEIVRGRLRECPLTRM